MHRRRTSNIPFLLFSHFAYFLCPLEEILNWGTGTFGISKNLATKFLGNKQASCVSLTGSLSLFTENVYRLMVSCMWADLV